jgi:uncharacterized delta-60 repeat protein
MKFKFIFTNAAMVLASTLFAQNAWNPDASFGSSGIVTYDFGAMDNLTDVVRDEATGKIYACGTALSPAFAGRLALMRYNDDGTLDTDFNGTGTLLIEEFQESYAYKVLPLSTGKVLVAGLMYDSNYVAYMLALRFNADGTPDTSWGANGYFMSNFVTGDELAHSAVETSDHGIVLCGQIIDENFRYLPALMKLTEQGYVDTNFGTGGFVTFPCDNTDNDLVSIMEEPNGNLVACGHVDMGFTNEGGIDLNWLLVRTSSTGVPDANFGTNGKLTYMASAQNIDKSFSIVRQGDGKYVVGGFGYLPDFSTNGFIVRFNNDGTTDSSFGTNGKKTIDYGPSDIISEVALVNDYKILAGGYSIATDVAVNEFLLARFNADGSEDGTFNVAGFVNPIIGNINDNANALHVQADGKAILAGKSDAGGNNNATIIRFGTNGPLVSTEETESELLRIYPSQLGASEMITIAGKNNETQPITWTDMQGRVVSKGQLKSGENSIQAPAVAAGNYILSIGNKSTKVNIVR